jgi:hypothetical protein
MMFSTTRHVGHDQQSCALVKWISQCTLTPLWILACALRSTRISSVPNSTSSSCLMRAAQRSSSAAALALSGTRHDQHSGWLTPRAAS